MKPSILTVALAAIIVLGLAAPGQAGFVKSGVAYYVELVADHCQDGGALDYLGFRNQTCSAGTNPYDTQKTLGPVVRSYGKLWMQWILTKTGTASNGDDLVTFRTKAPESARCSGFMLPEKEDSCDDKRTHIHPESPYVWRLTPVPNTDSYEIIAESRSPQCLRFLGANTDCKNKFTSLFAADDGSGYQRWRINPVNPAPVAGLKIAAKETGPTSAVVEITSTGEPIPASYKCTYSLPGGATQDVTVPATGTSTTVPLTGLTPSTTYSVTCVGLDAAQKPVTEPATTSFTTPSGSGPGISAKPTSPTTGDVTLTTPSGVKPVSYKCTYSLPGGATQEVTVPATGTSTTVPLTGLTPSTTYSVTCVGLDAAQKPVTEPSTTSLTTPNAATVPGAPTSVIATVNPTDGCATVTWQAPLDNGSPVTGYNVVCTSTGGASIGPEYYPGGATTTTAGGASLCGVRPDVTYICTVSAVNAIGTGTAAPSNPFSYVTPGPECPTLRPTLCPGKICVDSLTDRNNCGACGNVCPGTVACVNGVCVYPPGAPTSVDEGTVTDTTWETTWVDGTAGNPVEEYIIRCIEGSNKLCDAIPTANTIIESTPVNRGDETATITGLAPLTEYTCYIVAYNSVGAVCSAEPGVAVETICPPDFTDCDGECIDINGDDIDNCGSCGASCYVGGSCSEGECYCPAGETTCTVNFIDSCVDTETDSQHCGACGNVCPTGSTCTGGTCVCNNAPYEKLCPVEGVDTCVNILTDENNCRYCGTVCPSNSLCINADCHCFIQGEIMCPVEGVDTCVNKKTDEQHCGGCGNVCPADSTCVDGSCKCDNEDEMICPVNNNGNLIKNNEGICTDITTDQNCGACGNVCQQGQQCWTGSCASA